MRPETEARIRNVQKFGKNGRQFCVLAGAVFGITLFVSWATILAGPRMSGGSIRLGALYRVPTDQLTTVQMKVWVFLVVTAVLGVLAWTLLHLYRLFRHLEAGSIYTKQNVYHLRQIALLSMAYAAIQLILPLASYGLAEIGFIDAAAVAFVTSGSDAPLWGYSIAGFVSASLVLLASWIMDVGREVSEDAETMRREADLVI